MRRSGAGFAACGKTQFFVIPRRAARRGISLFLGLNQRGIPHFVRNDKINYYFRSLFSLWALVGARSTLATTQFHKLKAAPEYIHECLSKVQ
jgi:hypothetical protein